VGITFHQERGAKISSGTDLRDVLLWALQGHVPQFWRSPSTSKTKEGKIQKIARKSYSLLSKSLKKEVSIPRASEKTPYQGMPLTHLRQRPDNEPCLVSDLERKGESG